MSQVNAKLQIGSTKYNCSVDVKAFDADKNVMVGHDGMLLVHLTKIQQNGLGDSSGLPLHVTCCKECSTFRRHQVTLQHASVAQVLKALSKAGRGCTIEIERVDKIDQAVTE